MNAGGSDLSISPQLPPHRDYESDQVEIKRTCG